MKVYLGLLEDDNRTARHVEALHNDWQHLAYAKAYVSELDLRHFCRRSNKHFILLPVRAELLDLELANQAHRLKPLSHHFCERLCPLLRRGIEGSSASRKNGFDCPVPLDPHMVG